MIRLIRRTLLFTVLAVVFTLYATTTIVIAHDAYFAHGPMVAVLAVIVPVGLPVALSIWTSWELG